MVPQILLISGVVLSAPVLITHRRALYGPVLFEAASASIYCTTGDWSACGPCTNPILMIKAGWFFATISGSVSGGKTEISL